MQAALLPPTFGDVNDDEAAGRDIERRRLALGMTAQELADYAGVHRITLAKVEDGDPTVRPLTVSKVHRALANLEHEMGMDTPGGVTETSDVSLVEVQGTNPEGFSYVVRGKIADREKLNEMLQDLLKQTGQDNQE